MGVLAPSRARRSANQRVRDVRAGRTDEMICEKCEALSALIDGYRRERDEARASVADAYRRGAEAMRGACAREALVCANHRGDELDAILSALPIPEEP
jgi:hypothetical protein